MINDFIWFEDCRACKCKEFFTSVDLGSHPLPNVYPSAPNEVVKKYPLGLNFCSKCTHSQLFGIPNVSIFEDYSYVNTSPSYQLHQQSLVDYCLKKMHLRFMCDVGGNNGDLARFFKQRDVYASVIDPSRNHEISRFNRGIPSIATYYTEDLVSKITHKPDLIVMCNVLPHTPDPEGLLRASKNHLQCSTNSKILVEFVYFKSTYELRDLGQIYFEHCSYFTLNSLKALLERVDMAVNDIEFFPEVHGGTIRVLIDPCFQPSDHCPKFYEMLHAENLSGVVDYESLKEWGDLLKSNVKALANKLGEFTMDQSLIFYGASAKVSTLCNMPEFGRVPNGFEYAVDDNPLKQGNYIPGTKILIKPPKAMEDEIDPVVIIGAHNHKADLIKRIKGIIPKATIVNYVPTVQVEELC